MYSPFTIIKTMARNVTSVNIDFDAIATMIYCIILEKPVSVFPVFNIKAIIELSN